MNPARRAHAYIVNESAGDWSKSGAWHSNFDYEGRWWAKYDNDNWKYQPGETKSKSYLWTGDHFQEVAPHDRKPDKGMSPWACEVCDSWNAVDMVTKVCEICGACNDCLEHETDCMCYIPASASRALALVDKPSVEWRTHAQVDADIDRIEANYAQRLVAIDR